jgi:excisionase family DNA binding protein
VTDLDALLGPTLVAAIEQLVDERVARAVAEQNRYVGVLPPWLTVPQAAEMLGCSPEAVRQRIRRGRLATRRQGRRVYVARTSVVELDETVLNSRPRRNGPGADATARGHGHQEVDPDDGTSLRA